MKLAVLILTYNEELHIADCIKSACFADEIVVIDSGSTDKTVQLAQSAGARVVTHPMSEGFAAQRNFALTQTEAEWVLFLDADERITNNLAVEIEGILANEKPFGYSISRRNIVMGKWLRFGGWYPDRQLRFYPRNVVQWEGLVHEKAVVNVPIKKLQGDLVHYTYHSLSQNMDKQNKYSTLMARRMYDKGKKAKMSDVVFRPFWSFFRSYILQGGVRDGLLGFIMAMSHSFYTLMKYAKLYYMYQEKE